VPGLEQVAACLAWVLGGSCHPHPPDRVRGRLCPFPKGRGKRGVLPAEGIERLAALDGRWAEGHGILKRLGRVFREQTAEEIEDSVAHEVAEVRAESRCGVECPPRAAC